MTPKEAEARVRHGEDSQTELKVGPIHADDLAAALVSFANSGGGELIFGASDARQAVGLSEAEADETVQSAENVSRHNVEPAIPILWEKIDVDGKLLLVIRVPVGPERPYRTNRGVYFVRVGRSRRIASRQEILDLYQSAGSLHPDETTVPNTGVADLDMDYLRRVRPELFLRAPDPAEPQLRAVNILGSQGLTLGGLLCFGRNIQRCRRYARITAIRFKGKNVDQEFEDRQELEGRLDEQFEAATRFLEKHIGPPDRILQPARAEEFRLPMAAVREAVVNALAHRDYLQNAQVRLLLFEDRLEVVSPGRLLNRVTVEAMRTGFHLVRNPVIFSHFLRLRLVTEAGLGIPTMIQLLQERGLPEPEILPSPGDLRLIFRFQP